MYVCVHTHTHTHKHTQLQLQQQHNSIIIVIIVIITKMPVHCTFCKYIWCNAVAFRMSVAHACTQFN